MNISMNELFEELQRRIDTPEAYNSLMSKLFANVQSGSIMWDNGIPYVADPLRGKQLSLNRANVSAGYYGMNQSHRYLRMEGVTSAGNGFLLPRKATITAFWAKSRSPGSWAVEIRKNDQITPIATLNVNGQAFADTLDVDVEAGDFLQLIS